MAPLLNVLRPAVLVMAAALGLKHEGGHRERAPPGSFAEFARSIGPTSRQKVQQAVQASFSVVEHELAELGKIDYSDREDACVPGAYINAVVHIKNNTWRTTCGEIRTGSGYEAGRGQPLAHILDKVVPTLPPGLDIMIPFGLHDGVQFIPGSKLASQGPRPHSSQSQPVLGTAYHQRFSPFAIPFALGCQRTQKGSLGYVNTPVVGWDEYVKTWFACNSSAPRIKKAVFRGKAAPHSMQYGACKIACGFKDNGRVYVHWLGEQRPDIFDTSVSNADMFNPELTVRSDAFLNLPDQLCNYQAVLNIGNNMDWAERLRQSFYGNAVIMHPEGAPSEFFSAFMEPYKHYWPVASDLSNLTEEVEQVLAMPAETLRAHLKNQREFAAKYLNENFQLYYNKIVIEEYFKRKQLFFSLLSDNVTHFPPGYGLTNESKIHLKRGEPLAVTKDGHARDAVITDISIDQVKVQFTDYNSTFDSWLYMTSGRIRSDEGATFERNDHIMVNMKGQWRDAVVVMRNNEGKVKVHFPEFDAKFEERIQRHSHRFDSLKQAKDRLKVKGCRREDFMNDRVCPPREFPGSTPPR